MTNTYLVKIDWYNEIEERTDTEYGALHASSFAEAARIVEDQFGLNLEELNLYPIEDEEILYLNKEMYDTIREGKVFEGTEA